MAIELHKIKSQCNVNLYNTSIYTRNLKYYPLFKIDNEILDDNFKYKKYIEFDPNSKPRDRPKTTRRKKGFFSIYLR